MHTLILQHMLPCFLAIPLFWWGRGGRKATDAARQRAGPCYCCRWWKQNPFFFSHYQLSNVAKPTSASQSNISFLSSLCEVWELQYVLPAASRKLLCIVLLKWLQKCCQRDTVNCSFCVYVFFYLKKKGEKEKNPKTLWSWKNWFLLVLSVLFTFLWQTLDFPLCYSQCKHIQYWIDLFDSFWTCSIRFQMHWFMRICKVPKTLKKRSTLTQELFYIRII